MSQAHRDQKESEESFQLLGDQNTQQPISIVTQTDSEESPRIAHKQQRLSASTSTSQRLKSKMLLNDASTIQSRRQSLLNRSSPSQSGDLGSKLTRLVARDGGGHAHIKTKGQMRKLSYVYHEILDIPWPRLLLYFLATFALFNLLFATLFWAIDGVTDGGVDKLSWFDCFDFTLQTMDTIGYGHLRPKQHAGNGMVFLTSFCANTYWALVTGIVFAKLSRPSRLKRTVKFSNVAVVNRQTDYFQPESHELLEHGEYQQGEYNVLSFRFALMRVRSRMCDTDCHLMLFERKTRPDGYEDFSFTELDYELNRQQSGRTRTMDFSSPLLVLPITICHRIDESSPMYGLSVDDMMRRKMEVVCVIDWIDEATSDNCQVWFSYVGDEILFGHRFVPMVKSIRVADTDHIHPQQDFDDTTTEMTLTQENYDPYVDGNDYDDFDRKRRAVSIVREKLEVDYDRISFTRPIAADGLRDRPRRSQSMGEAFDSSRLDRMAATKASDSESESNRILL